MPSKIASANSKVAASPEAASSNSPCQAPAFKSAPSAFGRESAMARLVKIKEAATLLGCSAVTIRRRVKDGSLPCYRDKGRLRFSLRDLRLYLEHRRVNPVEATMFDEG
jgi:excisionase family DNA binding protein